MTIQEIKKSSIVLKVNQRLQIKGGTGEPNDSNIIIIDDIDSF